MRPCVLRLGKIARLRPVQTGSTFQAGERLDSSSCRYSNDRSDLLAQGDCEEEISSFCIISSLIYHLYKLILIFEQGIVEHFFIPCFIERQDIAVMLGIECAVDSLEVTFLFLPPPNAVTSPCFDNTVRVKWQKDGHTSALNLNVRNYFASNFFLESEE